MQKMNNRPERHIQTKPSIAIAVPYYKNELTDDEQASLQACLRILGRYDTFLVAPRGLDTSVVTQAHPTLEVERFDDSYFQSLRGYNKLMLDERFYERFARYDYILIYQLDAYVFKDELQQWADKGYDYIGAPWIGKSSTPEGDTAGCRFKRFWYRLTNNRKRLVKHYWGGVGNGGFSLRRVNRMRQITRRYRKKIDRMLDDDRPFYAEDVWLFLEPGCRHRLRVPPFGEALAFAMETMPETAYRWNHGMLPFGCHAFGRDAYKDFWAPFIRQESNIHL